MFPMTLSLRMSSSVKALAGQRYPLGSSSFGCGGRSQSARSFHWTSCPGSSRTLGGIGRWGRRSMIRRHMVTIESAGSVNGVAVVAARDGAASVRVPSECASKATTLADGRAGSNRIRGVVLCGDDCDSNSTQPQAQFSPDRKIRGMSRAPCSTRSTSMPSSAGR